MRATMSRADPGQGDEGVLGRPAGGTREVRNGRRAKRDGSCSYLVVFRLYPFRQNLHDGPFRRKMDASRCEVAVSIAAIVGEHWT